MIPAFNAAGVLPPFVGADPADMRGVSPYSTSMLELVRTLSTSKERIQLCRGLVAFRKELHAIGIGNGLQWINGSFCEQVEVTRGRAPADIDLVTLLARPPAYVDDGAWAAFVNGNSHLFDRTATKAKFSCDAFSVDLNNQNVASTISQITYWFGLFTHQRSTFQWKGILQLPLISDDQDAENYLATLP